MKYFLIFSVLFFCLPTPRGFADDSSLLKTVQREIGRTGIAKKHFGVWVKKDVLRASLNSDRLFVPASLSKIPTALSAMSQFPMGHRFYTWVYKTGKVEGGVLKGDLYLKGGGDPTLVSETLWMLVEKLKRDGIRKIDGSVFFDDSYFDRDHYSAGRQGKRVDRAYDAPVSALSFNWNSVAVHIRPGAKRGQPGQVFFEPPIPYLVLDNQTKTTRSGATKLSVSRVSLEAGEKLIVRGSISMTKKEKTFYKSISRPALWTAKNFLYLLKKSGVNYEGKLSAKETPSHADLLVEHESWEMPRILAALSKFSNNFIAEMLTKHLGKEKSQAATIGRGLAKIESFLNKNGWQPGDYTFVNPSGFTHNNKMRPDRLGELLHKSKDLFSLAPEFMSALPISGVDGTLKDRMGRSLLGKVRAKTGYLSGTVGLAGFVHPPGGGAPATFVLMYNGPAKHDWTVKKLFDRMVSKIQKQL